MNYKNASWMFTLLFLLAVLLNSCIPAIGTSPLRPFVTSSSGEVQVKAGTTTYIASLSKFGGREGCKFNVSTDASGRAIARPSSFNAEDMTSSFEFGNISGPENWQIELVSVIATCKAIGETSEKKVVFAVTVPEGEKQNRVSVNITLLTIRTKEPRSFNFKILVDNSL